MSTVPAIGTEIFALPRGERSSTVAQISPNPCASTPSTIIKLGTTLGSSSARNKTKSDFLIRLDHIDLRNNPGKGWFAPKSRVMDSKPTVWRSDERL